MKIVKPLLISGIVIAAIVGNQVIVDHIPTQAAQKVFNARQYDPARDVQFRLYELQDYSVETAQESVRLTNSYQLGLLTISASLIAIILLYKTESRDEKLWRRWKRALQSGDTLEQATLELQIKESE